jgi:hypothetical protein
MYILISIPQNLPHHRMPQARGSPEDSGMGRPGKVRILFGVLTPQILWVKNGVEVRVDDLICGHTLPAGWARRYVQDPSASSDPRKEPDPKRHRRQCNPPLEDLRPNPLPPEPLPRKASDLNILGIIHCPVPPTGEYPRSRASSFDMNSRSLVFP